MVLGVAASACFVPPDDTKEDDPMPSTSGTDSASGSQPSSSGPEGSTAETMTEPGTSTTGDGPGITDTGSTSTAASSGSSGSSGATQWSPCPTFVDMFDRAADDNWEHSDEASTSVSGSQLMMNVSAAVDGLVQMRVRPETGLVGATATAQLSTISPQPRVLQMIRLATPNSDLLSYRVHVYPTETRLEVWHSAGNADPIIEYDEAITTGAPLWLRISEDAGMLRFQRSQDGVAFDDVVTVAAPFDVSQAAIGVAASNYELLQDDVQVGFGEFSLQCGPRRSER